MTALQPERKSPRLAGAAPAIVLVGPQLGENIGMAARAMGNFGLRDLRLVSPRDGWPNPKAVRAAAGADVIVNAATVHDSAQAAIADCTLVFATSARAHDQAKPLMAPDAAAREMAQAIAGGERVAILFGRERAGLDSHEVALADRLVTFPVDPGFASLNLAQAVLLMGYEWFRHAHEAALPFVAEAPAPRAAKEQVAAFFDNLVALLDRAEFLRPAEKRDTMIVNLRNIFTRMEPSRQDMQTLHGVIRAISEGARGPAAGGVLDGAEAAQLRALLAEHGAGHMPGEQGPVRGLARLLRRNTSEAERTLWRALTRDRRFAGAFKRQTPVGRQIPDFVSFVHRLAVELVAEGEADSVAADRRARAAWLTERGYRVVEIGEAEIADAREAALARIAAAIG
jgi:tRNA/rRNA methyltransferase